MPCYPSPQQYMRAMTVSGDYAKYTSYVLKDLLKIMDVQPVVPSNTVRELMSRALPKRKDISHRDVHNIRIRAKLLLKDMYA